MFKAVSCKVKCSSIKTEMQKTLCKHQWRLHYKGQGLNGRANLHYFFAKMGTISKLTIKYKNEIKPRNMCHKFTYQKWLCDNN